MMNSTFKHKVKLTTFLCHISIILKRFMYFSKNFTPANIYFSIINIFDE